MDNIGAEVGQKMRSAIKAKLLELGCYVDDELPDYIMVMVANKRTEDQMKEDLKLFLTTKTDVFVDWLQIVLNKLKEVTVTNPEVYKKVAKRKFDEKVSDIKVKKEKKEKEKKDLKTSKKEKSLDEPQTKSLTDDLPIEAIKLSKKRKIIVEDKNNTREMLNEDDFDIPSLSAVTNSTENELLEIESKIASVKSRLGLHVPSDPEEEEFLTLKAETDELFSSVKDTTKNKTDNSFKENRKINIIQENIDTTNIISKNDVTKHSRVIFDKDNTKNSSPKKSIYERLGKRNTDVNKNDYLPSQPKVRKNDSNSDFWREKLNKENGKEKITSTKSSNDDSKQKRESVLKRLGVKSKISIPEKLSKSQHTINETVDEIKINKEVASAIKVKPRVIPSSVAQPNKNLLLKAVAEAQRSIAQTPIVGSNLSPKSLISNKIKKKEVKNKIGICRLPKSEKDKLRNILTQKEEKKDLSFSSDDDNLEYVPKPLKKVSTGEKDHEYVPSYKNDSLNAENLMKTTLHHRFVITLDGIDKNKCKEIISLRNSKTDMDNEQQQLRKKSPIIFADSKPEIPDTLQKVEQISPTKSKEQCKYWPNCTKGEKCQFIHPILHCKNFPHCKFGEKCLYLHPPCKFEKSCTRKDCPFSHGQTNYLTGQFLPPHVQQCKFFPNCTNVHCSFYHPRPCRFGKFCKNKSECNFLHTTSQSPKQNLTWKN